MSRGWDTGAFSLTKPNCRASAVPSAPSARALPPHTPVTCALTRSSHRITFAHRLPPCAQEEEEVEGAANGPAEWASAEWTTSTEPATEPPHLAGGAEEGSMLEFKRAVDVPSGGVYSVVLGNRSTHARCKLALRYTCALAYACPPSSSSSHHLVALFLSTPSLDVPPAHLHSPALHLLSCSSPQVLSALRSGGHSAAASARQH